MNGRRSRLHRRKRSDRGPRCRDGVPRVRHDSLVTWTRSGLTHLARQIVDENDAPLAYEVLCEDIAREWRTRSVGDLSVVVTCLWCATMQELR